MLACLGRNVGSLDYQPDKIKMYRVHANQIWLVSMLELLQEVTLVLQRRLSELITIALSELVKHFSNLLK
jgi:hypothetical protein